MTLTAPSALRWKMPHAAGASAKRQSMSSRFVDAERVIFSQEGHDVGSPALHIGLAHPELDLLVEQRHHRHWIGHAAVGTRQRHRAAPTSGFDRRGRCLPEPTARPAEPGAETHAARIAIGQAAVETT
jgi:hypothetical protein